VTRWGLLIGRCPYDPNDRESVLAHARQLEGRSLREAIEALLPAEDRQRLMPTVATLSRAGGKGDLGNCIEAGHFYYPPNSDSRPDFPWGDLKCTGLRMRLRAGPTPKERLVLAKIDYLGLPGQTFEEFSRAQKLTQLLLVFYVYEAGVGVLDRRIDLVGIWQPTEDDLRIIREDWLLMRALVAGGRAEDLSESLTRYLGACPKAGDSSARTPQPFGDEAMPRAYCLKRGFLAAIYDELRAARGATPAHSVPLLGLEDFLRSPATFESFVAERLNRFRGLPLERIRETLSITRTFAGKARHAHLAWAILNKLTTGSAKTPADRVAQFRKAGLTIRVVRIRRNGRPAEDVSFPAFDYGELAAEEHWEDSLLYSQLSARFLFVFLLEGEPDAITFSHASFWSMPEHDLMGDAARVWTLTRDLVRASRMDGLPRGSDTATVHVRPHDKDSSRTVALPDGSTTFRRSFWLNKRYVGAIFEGSRPQ
jgi:DNA mismatch repair protein MutH